MSLKNTYRKITSIFTLTVMLWNIVGWLGFGLILNHAHSHNKAQQCDVVFCFCEVEEAGDVCTCHHNEMKTSEKNSDTTHHGEDCFFNIPHDSNTNTTQGLIVIAKFNALYVDMHPLNLPADLEFYLPLQSENILPGVIPDLLRPPRV